LEPTITNTERGKKGAKTKKNRGVYRFNLSQNGETRHVAKDGKNEVGRRKNGQRDMNISEQNFTSRAPQKAKGEGEKGRLKL